MNRRDVQQPVVCCRQQSLHAQQAHQGGAKMTSVTAHAAKSLTERVVLRFAHPFGHAFAHAFGQGLLWVLEQIPGHITTGDQTEFLTTKVRTRNEKQNEKRETRNGFGRRRFLITTTTRICQDRLGTNRNERKKRAVSDTDDVNQGYWPSFNAPFYPVRARNAF